LGDESDELFLLRNGEKPMNHKPFLLLTILLLFVLLVSTVGAQDSIVDQEVEEAVILKREVTPDGIHTIVQVPNKKDAYIASNRPDENFGLQGDMRLGYNLTGEGLGAMRLLLQYQVQEYVPKGAVVNSAKLRFYLTGVSPYGDSDMGFKARYVATEWSEKTVTWNNHQAEWGSEIGIGYASSQLGWHEGDVTQMVREWVDGGRPNYGFTILGDEQGYDPNNPDGSPGSGIRYYDVWDSTTNGSSWNIWRAQVTETKSTFEGGEHLKTYSFTARAKDNAGNEQPQGGVQASTKVDAVAPVVSMNALPPITTSPSVTISWRGTDSGSGIKNYDVQWREQGQAWQWLYENTTLTSAARHGAKDGVTYEFRARGSDKVGNNQAWTDVQASTTIALKPYSTITGTNPQQILQIKSGPGPSDSFQVFWEGHTAPGTTPLTYNVYVDPPNGGWTEWLQGTSVTSDAFVLKESDPDGTYYFEVTARNNMGQQEDRTQTPEGYIIVDRHAPFIEQAVWMPAIFMP
jgi:hypothetical protein